MKKRKSMIMLAVFVAVLVLGVGYATISGVTLDITGTAAAADRDLKVAFNGTVTPNAGTTNATVAGSAQNNSLHGTITVSGLENAGDVVAVTYTIKNEETDIDATVVRDTLSNSNPDYFDVYTNVDDEADAITILAGGTNTVTVYVELKAVPILEADSSTDIEIDFAAEPVVTP